MITTTRTPLLGLLAFAAMALTAGCSLNDSGSKPGELGNGGFYLSCDDAVACSRYSDDAAKFPEAVSVGSTFAIRFVPKKNSGLDIHFNDSVPERGITVGPVSEVYISRGSKGLAAVKTGYATIASRDSTGALIDYTVLRVAKPDALVVYSADDTTTTTPAHVNSITMSAGDRKSFRAFAQQGTVDLAGSLQIEWTSSDPKVFVVESTTEGKATIATKAAGTATLVATGGTFTQNIPITVSP